MHMQSCITISNNYMNAIRTIDYDNKIVMFLYNSWSRFPESLLGLLWHLNELIRQIKVTGRRACFFLRVLNTLYWHACTLYMQYWVGYSCIHNMWIKQSQMCTFILTNLHNSGSLGLQASPNFLIQLNKRRHVFFMFFIASVYCVVLGNLERAWRPRL